MALSCPASWRSCGRASPGSLRRPGRTTVTTLDNHILPVLRDKRVEETRPRLVGAFLRHLQDEKGLSAATARKARTVLSAVLSYAVAMEYVESNVADEGAAARDPCHRAGRSDAGGDRQDPPGGRDQRSGVPDLSVGGGRDRCRRGETLALRWGGVDFDAGTISIDGTVSIGDDGAQLRPWTKTRKSRKVALSSITQAASAQGSGREAA